jgi:hypothetical protein
MEMSSQELEVCPQESDKEVDCHSLGSSFVLKAVLGNLIIISFDPHNAL